MPTRYPHRNSYDSPDVLDIDIVNGVTLQLRSIETLSELDSGHRPILIQLGSDKILHQPVKTVIDWKKLESELSSLDWIISTPLSVNA